MQELEFVVWLLVGAYMLRRHLRASLTPQPARPPAPKFIPGVILEAGTTRSLSWEEYEYWTRNPLPKGWAIVREPVRVR